MDTKTCMKCGKGGSVLVCSSSKCLVSIHEGCCVPSSLQVHDRGNFLCPYCLYKQSVAKCCQAKDKALLAEKNLALFLGTQISVNQEHEPDIAMDKSITLHNHKEHGNQDRVRKNKERVCFRTEKDQKNGECSHAHVREMLSDEHASSSKLGKKGGYLRNCSMKPVENQKNHDSQFSGNVPSKWEGKVLVVEPVSSCRLRTPIHKYPYENQNFGKSQQHPKPLDLCNKETDRAKLAEMDLVKRKNKRCREAGPCETAIFSIIEDNRSEIYEESDSVSEAYTYCNDRSEVYSRLARGSIENAFEFKNYSPGKACDPKTVITGDAEWIDKPSKEIKEYVFSRQVSKKIYLGGRSWNLVAMFSISLVLRWTCRASGRYFQERRVKQTKHKGFVLYNGKMEIFLVRRSFYSAMPLKQARNCKHSIRLMEGVASD